MNEMHAVIETPDYLVDVARVGMTKDQQVAVKSMVANNPQHGDLIKGTGGVRKFRVGGHGKGKSGGFRIFSFFGGDDVPALLVAVLSKNQRANISPAERNTMRKEYAGYVSDYLEGARKLAGRAKTTFRRKLR